MNKDKKDVTIEQFNDAIDALLQKPSDGNYPEEPDEETTGHKCMATPTTCR